MTCDVHTKPPKPMQVGGDVHTEPLDPALVGEVCAECGAQAETIWGEKFYCMTHAWDEWERMERAMRHDAQKPAQAQAAPAQGDRVGVQP